MQEIRETRLFTIASNNTKYLGAYLTRQAKDLYDKQLQVTEKKEIEEGIRRWKDLS